jgi:hypothetical protein
MKYTLFKVTHYVNSKSYLRSYDFGANPDITAEVAFSAIDKPINEALERARDRVMVQQIPAVPDDDAQEIAQQTASGIANKAHQLKEALKKIILAYQPSYKLSFRKIKDGELNAETAKNLPAELRAKFSNFYKDQMRAIYLEDLWNGISAISNAQTAQGFLNYFRAQSVPSNLELLSAQFDESILCHKGFMNAVPGNVSRQFHSRREEQNQRQKQQRMDEIEVLKETASQSLLKCIHGLEAKADSSWGIWLRYKELNSMQGDLQAEQEKAKIVRQLEGMFQFFTVYERHQEYIGMAREHAKLEEEHYEKVARYYKRFDDSNISSERPRLERLSKLRKLYHAYVSEALRAIPNLTQEVATICANIDASFPMPHITDEPVEEGVEGRAHSNSSDYHSYSYLSRSMSQGLGFRDLDLPVQEQQEQQVQGEEEGYESPGASI